MPQFISPDMWPANSPDLNVVDYSIWGMLPGRVYRVPICDTDELRKRLVAMRHGLNFSTAWWTMLLIVAKKTRSNSNVTASVQSDHLLHGYMFQKHVSVQKVVALNTCCDVACMTFQLPHITNGCFQSHQRLEECNITFRLTSFAFYKVVRLHFSGVVGKG